MTFAYFCQNSHYFCLEASQPRATRITKITALGRPMALKDVKSCAPEKHPYNDKSVKKYYGNWNATLHSFIFRTCGCQTAESSSIRKCSDSRISDKYGRCDDMGRYRYMQICMDKVDKVRQPTCSSQLLQLRSRSQLTPNRSLLDCFRFNGPSNRHVLWTRLVEKRDAKCASESPLRCKKHVNSMEASNQKSAIWTIGVLWKPYNQFSVIIR